MSPFEPCPPPYTDRMPSVLRIVAGAIFVTSGTMKLFGYPALPAGMPPIELLSEAGIAGLLECVGGTAIVLGLFTRPVAVVLAGEMAVAGAGSWSVGAVIARSRAATRGRGA